MATQTNDAAGQAADAAPGMPQLDFSTFGNQIFWLVVTLVAIYLILDRIALPRIAEVLAAEPDSVNVSIDGAEPEVHDRLRGTPGSFDRITAGIRRLLRAPGR